MKQIDNVKRMLFLGRVLGRTVVLPKFDCAFTNGDFISASNTNCTAERLIDVVQLRKFRVLENSYLVHLKALSTERLDNVCDVKSSRYSSRVLVVENLECLSFPLQNNTFTWLRNSTEVSLYMNDIQNLKYCMPEEFSNQAFLGYGPFCR